MSSRIIIAGEESGSGKTTITLGLMKAFSKRGLKVQGFKTGPDYIDPSYYEIFTGRKGRNLDLWMLNEGVVLELFDRNSAGADLSIIEGVMGLFDGAYPDDRGSTAHLSRVLKAPVILVVNVGGSSTSIAATVLGFKLFDPEVRIEGVILNGVGGEAHFNHVKGRIEQRTGIRVLGGIPRREEVSIEERHLGLIPAVEKSDLINKAEKIAALLENHIDLESFVKIAKSSPQIPPYGKTVFIGGPKENIVRVGLARDEAFSFYYEDNLDLLIFYGCEIIPFSPMRDERLPSNLDGIYIGGGFPEVYADVLEKNSNLKEEIRNFVISGKSVYAECGGLMYLGEQIETVDEKGFNMVGVLPIKTVMRPELRVLGYREVFVEKRVSLFDRRDRMKGHEFHYSELIPRSDLNFSYRVLSSAGGIGKDGLYFKNTLASYTHIHLASNPEVAKRIPERIKNAVECCIKIKGQG
ncbi:MAG: cobyrinic acid a,c-diamide synthase [Candidatus Dadabacteria bacterium]